LPVAVLSTHRGVEGKLIVCGNVLRVPFREFFNIDASAVSLNTVYT